MNRRDFVRLAGSGVSAAAMAEAAVSARIASETPPVQNRSRKALMKAGTQHGDSDSILRVLAGFGWQRDDVKLVQQMASNGAEPVGSLGYDGPLAALSPERQNLADYFKETVAVLTNPALDRERELEHSSTRALFGRRPSIDTAGVDTGTASNAGVGTTTASMTGTGAIGSASGAATGVGGSIQADTTQATETADAGSETGSGGRSGSRSRS